MNRAEGYAAARRLGASLPWADLPIVTRALPTAGSLLLLATAGVALLVPEAWGMAAVLLWAQVFLLAYGANRTAAVAHERLLPWERRAAPARARERVRAWLLRRLGWLAGLGMVGPLALAAVRDSQADELRMLPGMAALLSASLAGGLLLGLSWRGRAPRVLALAAIALLAHLLLMGGIRAVGRGDPLASLAILACAGLLWCSLLPAGALAAGAPPLPRLGAPAWLRRALGRLLLARWGFVPYHVDSVGPSPSYSLMGGALCLPFSSTFRDWLSWGQPYGEAGAVGSYGLWLLLLGAVATGAFFAPPLNWRRRLAPRGVTARRWACGLVGGSMLMSIVLLTVVFGVTTMLSKHGLRQADAAILASALGDLLFVFSITAWLRGRSRRRWDGLPLLAGMALAAVALLAGLNALGVTPQRGPVWLLVQLALSVPFTVLAIRAWERHDLNAMARSVVWTSINPNQTGALNR